MAWMAVPSILALKNPSAQELSAKSLPRSVWTARMGMLAVFSLPIFAWLSFFDRSLPPSVSGFRLVVTLAAMMLMGALIFLKQHFLDVELIRLLRSSRQSVLDLQLLQAQLVQSEKLASMGQLVGGAAHELNNPLTAMLGYSELLATTDLNPQQRALSEKISQQAKRIRTLVSSLLSFAKQVPSSKSALDINVVVQTAIKLCQPQMQAANVQHSLSLDGNLPRIQGDSNQLLKVFSHIISNAVNAIGDRRNGQINLTTSIREGVVSIQIADSGPGIAEPARVFDPFYTTRPIGDGTGLGLSMCYGIIQEHGGKISCRNREEGGACFTVELPAASAARPQAQAHAANL
jgi:two-component system NtrC family sensor kinase